MRMKAENKMNRRYLTDNWSSFMATYDIKAGERIYLRRTASNRLNAVLFHSTGGRVSTAKIAERVSKVVKQKAHKKNEEIDLEIIPDISPEDWQKIKASKSKVLSNTRNDVPMRNEKTKSNVFMSQY